MRSRLRRRVALVLAVASAASLGAAGCYWLRYDALARTHVELLREMAAKLADVTGRDGVPPPELAEYRYPLARARDFVRVSARWYEERASLAALRELADAYADLLGAAERLRVRPDAPERRAFAAALDDVRARAGAASAALDRESGI